MGKRAVKNVLTIAGVDPSGGAGVLADIKAMSALGTFATGVVAALTAQNTRTVSGVMPVPADFVRRQIDTLFEDVRIDAVKIGMLGAKDVMATVAEALKAHAAPKIVLDTVMVAKSGDRLMPDDAVAFFRETLLPIAGLITPNLPEASVLLGREVTQIDQMHEAAQDLYSLCGTGGAVYLKGGHAEGDLLRDVFYDGKRFVDLDGPRVHTKNTHGTGCTLSSAIAALWARTDNLEEAVRAARRYMQQAVAAADDLSVGHGHGPVHHFARFEALFAADESLENQA
jgi:phosphomethylpyrimidine kinase